MKEKVPEAISMGKVHQKMIKISIEIIVSITGGVAFVVVIAHLNNQSSL